EHPAHQEIRALSRPSVRELEVMDTALGPLDLEHLLVPDHFDLGVRKRALLDDLGRAEPVAPVHDVDLGRIAREVVGLFDRGVSAPHHGQHFTLEVSAPPPPTTASTSPLKNAPSHTAQYDTPFPAYSFSPGTPSFTGLPPAVRITAGARYVFPRAVATSNQPSSALRMCSTVSVTISAPNFLACSAIFCASSHPLMLSNPM